MITLKKLNNEEVTINALFIEKVESKPDTIITLLSGKQLIVRNSVEEVVKAASTFYQTIQFKQLMKELNKSCE